MAPFEKPLFSPHLLLSSSRFDAHLTGTRQQCIETQESPITPGLQLDIQLWLVFENPFVKFEGDSDTNVTIV